MQLYQYGLLGIKYAESVYLSSSAELCGQVFKRCVMNWLSPGTKGLTALIFILTGTSLASADSRTRALTETFLPDLIKINHSPSSPLAQMDEDRFFKTNAVIVAYQLSQSALKQNDPTHKCFNDPYRDERQSALYLAKEQKAQAWMDEYFANFMGRHGELGRAEVTAFVNKTIATATADTPACRMVRNAFSDAIRFVRSFKK
jgi:hypothetical protein